MLNYDSLPGVVSEVRDYNLGKIEEPQATTESVLIIGTATDGPVGTPVKVSTIMDAYSIFGNFKDPVTGVVNNSTLVRGAIEAYKTGCRDIRLLRVSGKKATKEFTLTQAGYKLVAEGRYPGAIYNTVSIQFDHDKKKLVITKPVSKMTDYERSFAVGVVSEVVMDFYYADYVTPTSGNDYTSGLLVDFITKINRQPNNNVVIFRIIDANGNDVTNSLDTTVRAIKISDVTSTTKVTLSGGDDEINLDPLELYMRLGGYVTKYTLNGTNVTSEVVPTTAIQGYENAIYDNLVNYKVDIIALMVPADTNLWKFYDSEGNKKTELTESDFPQGTTVLYSTDDNFARQLAQACAVISAKSSECIGVIGCSPATNTDLLSIKKKVNELTGLDVNTNYAVHVSSKFDLFLKNETGQKIIGQDSRPIDIGGYINIVAAPELIFEDETLGYYASNGVAAYAGLISTLKPEYATTNKKLNGVLGLRYELSGNQLNILTNCGYVTFRNNYDNGVVVTDGVTAAGPLSDFKRLTTRRITNAAMALVRKVCEPFIGMPNNLAHRNAITTEIQAALDAMKASGAIQDASFEFYSSRQDQILGNAIIDLTIVPVFEFRKIRVFVNLKNPA